MLLLIDFYFLFQYFVHLDRYDVNYPAIVDLTLEELRFLIEFGMLKLNKILEFLFPGSLGTVKKEELMPDFLASSTIVAVLMIIFFIIVKLVEMFKEECKERLSKLFEN